jgi:hypothetical protein
VPGSLFDQMLDIPIVLLQVMRTQKQSLRPENLAIPRHSISVQIFRRSRNPGIPDAR